MGILQNDKINNLSVKTEIDALCKDLLMEDVSEYISTPVVLSVYLGEETYDVVNASLRDAFTTSFKIEPSVYDIRVQDPQVTSEYINGEIVDAIRLLVEQGKSYDDLSITFIALMDDPVFDSDYLGMIESIREALEQLSNYGMSIKKTSFYGLFRQIKMKQDYRYAFEFVNAGKDIWKSIYHMEVTVFARNIHMYTQLIAINILSDDYNMVQNMEAEAYNWKSIYLHYLKVPELIITRVLREIYSNQINGKNINYDEWSDNIKAELDRIFERLFEKKECDCEQYIPLYFHETVEEAPVKRGLFRKKQPEYQPVAYTNVIKDEISLDQILDSLYGTIELTNEDYEQIMEGIISSASSIDNDHNKISQFIRKSLGGMINEYQLRMENLKSKVQLDGEDTGNISAQIKKEYEKKKMILIIQKKMEIMNNLIEQLSNGKTLNRTVLDICQKNKKYTDVLDELSKNEYGGTLEHFHVSELPAFKVNQPVREILKTIDNDMLNKIMNDEDTIHQRLERFLTFTVSAAGVNNKHNLGEINGTYNKLEPVISAVLMTPRQGENEKVKEMVSKYANLYIKTNSLYRENTFYVISGREYSSDRYIIRYKRG